MPKAPGGTKPGWKAPPQHLRDMRHVYSKPKSPDETDPQKRLRQLMEEDFTKFMGMLQAAERQHAATKRTDQPADPTSKPGPEEEDEGTEAALAVYERCLREFAPTVK